MIKRIVFFALLLSYNNSDCCPCNSKVFSGYKDCHNWGLNTNVTFSAFNKESNKQFIQKNEILSEFTEQNINVQRILNFTFSACDYKNFSISIGESNIPCILLHKRGKGKPLLIYYHGSDENISNCLFIEDPPICGKGSFYDELTKYYDILIVELPGYASNKQGDFSKETRNKQIDEIYEWCQQNYDNNFVVMGYSLGCHFAILLAAKAGEHCKHLFLANPFLTDKTAAKYKVGYFSFLVPLLFKGRLDNGEKIKEVKCPIDFFYSDNDKNLSPDDSRGLYKKNPNKTNSYVLLPHFECVSYLNFYNAIINKKNFEKNGKNIEWLKTQKEINKSYEKYNHYDAFKKNNFIFFRLAKISETILQI